MSGYLIDGSSVDSIELKALVVSRGVKVSARIYKEFSQSHRIFANPLKCNCMVLPDGTIVQMTDLQLHMNYIKSAIS
jgi:hypothetical protein